MNTVTIENVDKLGKYHSCDRETYKKLRKVRFFRHVERIQNVRHERWSRKLPHNRVRWSKDSGEWKSTPWVEPEFCPVNLMVLENDFLIAKVGHTDPAKVRPTNLDKATLDAMIERLYEWSDRVYGHRC